MSLDTAISLTTVDEVLAFLGEAAERDGIWVYCSRGDATAATVEITATTIILIITGGGAAGTNTLTFAVAANDTIGKLVTVINALVGWEAGRLYPSAAASTDLIITGQIGCLGAVNEQTLLIQDVWLIEQLINRASDFLNRYCHRTLKTTAYTLERYNGEGRKLSLNNYPVTEIDQICQGTINGIQVRHTSTTAYNAYVIVSTLGITLVVDGTAPVVDLTFATNTTLLAMATAINAVAGWTATVANANYNSYPSSQIFRKLNRYALNQDAYLEIPDQPIDDFDVDYDAGIIHLPGSSFSLGFQNIFVSFMAGYVTIPAALEKACIEMVKYKYDLSTKDMSVKSETIGRVYSYTLGDIKKALPDDLMAELESFRAVLV